MNPIFVTAVAGRSGTTFLMRMLSSHRAIIAYEEYPLEFRPALYSVAPKVALFQSVTAGTWHFPDVETLLHRPLREKGNLEIDDVQGIYHALATAAGKSPCYFAEKNPVQVSLKGAALKAFPLLRNIVLVRDPRDIIVSMRHFDRRRGYHGFSEQEGDSDATVVRKMKDRFECLGPQIASPPQSYLVRYEDLVADTPQTLGRLLTWLGVDANRQTVDSCVARAAALEDGRHVTSGSLALSAGRWRAEMPPSLQALVADDFGPVLEEFGYALS